MCNHTNKQHANTQRRVVMHHTVKQSTGISLKSTQDKQEYDDQMDSDTKTTRSRMIKIIYQQVDQHVESNDVQ